MTTRTRACREIVAPTTKSVCPPKFKACPMVRIAITQAAFEAIAATFPSRRRVRAAAAAAIYG